MVVEDRNRDPKKTEKKISRLLSALKPYIAPDCLINDAGKGGLFRSTSEPTKNVLCLFPSFSSLSVFKEKGGGHLYI